MATEPAMPGTPKRKRSQIINEQSAPSLNTTQFSFDPYSAPPEDGSASPRSRVARRFQGLVLEGGAGGVPACRTSRSESPKPRIGSIDDTMEEDLAEGASRKRFRMPDVEMTDNFGGGDAAGFEPRTTTLRFAVIPSSPEPAQDGISSAGVPFPASQKHSETAPNSSISGLDGQKPLPPLPETVGQPSPKSSRHKRSGTPPSSSRNPSITSSRDSSEEPERVITDPVRASLTWHEDEITIYDPDDSDDDGTGINGIGFKPTPAIAYARTVKRKKQLAEYKKREEREARSRRSMRRRVGGSPAPGLVEMKEKAEQRRVRFLEATTQMIGA